MISYPFGLDEKQLQHFYGDEGIWRNTEHNEIRGEEPCGNSIVICHTDETEEYMGCHRIVITHARGHHGKGFIPQIWCGNLSFCASGDIHYGTNQFAYNQALEEGRRILAKLDSEQKERMRANAEEVEAIKQKEQ